MKRLLNKKLLTPTLLFLIFILSLGSVFSIQTNKTQIANLNRVVRELEKQAADLNLQVTNLSKENEALKKDDARVELATYNNAVGKYEAIKEKTASYKSKGVNVTDIEKKLPEAIDLILGKKYTEADTLLSQMDTDLEKLLKAKQDADAAALARSKFYYPPAASCTIPSAGYCYLSISTSNGTFKIHVVAINLSGTTIITDTANSSDCANNCPTKPLLSYVQANGTYAGIHGTYFCPPDYASCAGKVNSYDFPVYNSNLNKWLNEGNLSWSNRAMMAFTNSGVVFYPQANTYTGLSGLKAAITNFPGLVAGGNNIVNNYSLTSAQLTKGTRGGIGVKGGTLYLVVTSSATVPDLAAIMMALGVNSALNLDGGGSAALVYQGSYKVGPGRSLPNAILFK